jgi:hypothetical protein
LIIFRPPEPVVEGIHLRGAIVLGCLGGAGSFVLDGATLNLACGVQPIGLSRARADDGRRPRNAGSEAILGCRTVYMPTAEFTSSTMPPAARTALRTALSLAPSCPRTLYSMSWSDAACAMVVGPTTAIPIDSADAAPTAKRIEVSLRLPCRSCGL